MVNYQIDLHFVTVEMLCVLHISMDSCQNVLFYVSRWSSLAVHFKGWQYVE